MRIFYPRSESHLLQSLFQHPLNCRSCRSKRSPKKPKKLMTKLALHKSLIKCSIRMIHGLRTRRINLRN
ncbi:hypothetical protein AR158_c576R [Paramecium bursaria Chlorella virus AR158]|uniref:hypothetical protein n=1 Tax=Paramecium bursaria Chlorella virus AR158 TaxID=380598 RepID=UPI00015AA78E|nr:hypothetical protein AR158_c576R [Paramecium bursaria Chlorella virus AR158]ABU44121.1 hypothetical protein AR158_c576R [Paramecium bursaria Chlorella virus AR158]